MSAFAKIPVQAALYCFILTLLFAAPAPAQQPQILLGDANIENLLDSNPAGTAEAFPVQASATGQVTSLSVYLDRSNTAATVSVGMYANQNAHPGALLARGTITNPAAGQWNSVALTPVQVTSGTTYWLALLGVNGVVQFRDRYGRCRSEVSSQTNLSALPATWASGAGWTTCIASIFETGSATSGSTPTPSAGIVISPHSVSVATGHQQQFTAAVNGLSSTNVNWSASGGTISSAGMFTAPSVPGTYTVVARPAGSRRRSTSVFDTAVVQVVLPTPPPVTPPPVTPPPVTPPPVTPPPVTPPVVTVVTVSPTASSLQVGGKQQFTASVSGASNTGVTWSASAGTITTNGLYTAPSAAGSYTITAISKADTTKFASAIVIVSAAQTVPVTISISPTSSSLQASSQVQFKATVSGTSNTAVSWTVTQGSGTITQSGLYTAPKSAETDVITVTSQADTTKSSSASITILLPHSVSLQWVASKSAVAFYRVYRGTVSGGPYTMVASNISTTGYTDSTVRSGTTYFYVTSAVNAAGDESIDSNEFSVSIPTP